MSELTPVIIVITNTFLISLSCIQRIPFRERNEDWIHANSAVLLFDNTARVVRLAIDAAAESKYRAQRVIYPYLMSLASEGALK